MGELLVGTDSGLVGGGLDGHQVVGLTPDRWAVADHRTVWRAVDGSWHQVLDGDELGLALVSITHSPTGLLVGTSEAHLLRYDGSGSGAERVESFDRVPERDRWYTPWGDPADVRSLAVGPDLSLWANVHVGGVVRSVDAGVTWEPTLDIDVDVHQVLVHSDGTVLAPCGDGGLAVSVDGGETWRFDTEGLHATYCLAVAVAGSTVLVSAASGPFAKETAIYRKPLSSSDGAWERCTDLLAGKVDTFALIGDPSGRAVFGTSTGDVWESSDEGQTWERTHTGLASVRSLAFP